MTAAPACHCPTCGHPLSMDGFRFEIDAGIVIGGGRYAALTRTESEIFELLWQRPGQVLTDDTIRGQVYQLRGDDAPEGNIVAVLISKIRKKIAGTGLSIEVVWGRGFRLQKGGKHE